MAKRIENVLLFEVFHVKHWITLYPFELTSKSYHKQPIVASKKMDFYCKINLLSNGTFYESINFDKIVQMMMQGSIIKFVILKKAKQDILSFLRQFNIEPQYLFPGLEGLAKSQIFFLDSTGSSFKYSQ